MPGRGLIVPCGAGGGARGWLGGIGGWDIDADWLGLCGLVGGWARLTQSSPDESDSLSNSGIWWLLNGARVGCANFISFSGKQVSLNFTSWEILKCWCIPEFVSLGS